MQNVYGGKIGFMQLYRNILVKYRAEIRTKNRRICGKGRINAGNFTIYYENMTINRLVENLQSLWTKYWHRSVDNYECISYIHKPPSVDKWGMY